MKKGITLAALLLVLGVLFGYDYIQAPPPTERDSINKRIDDAKKTRSLSQAQENFLKLQLALVNYQVMNRMPPDNLNQLVPTYFDSVPMNSDTGKPFEYVREGNKYKLLGLSVSEGGTVVASSGKPGSLKAQCKQDDQECLSKGGFVNPNEIVEDTFRYDPTGKRDPFEPFDFSAKPKNPKAGTPLEQYDLGQLRLTAVLADQVRGPTGIIEDQVGKGFNVKIGTRIGINSGVIVSIEKDRIKVLETEKDLTGKETQRIVEMKIQSEPGGSGGPSGGKKATKTR
jgi:Tfp pilus assembly protein PilP